jgi:uncharacterized surface protein with fasciclin (FAS1) repeats
MPLNTWRERASKGTPAIALLLLIVAVAIAAVACGGEEATTTTAVVVEETTTTAATTAEAPMDIVDTLAANGSFSTFVQLLEDIGLTTPLKNPGPYTVFAPIDAGLAEIPPEVLDALAADTSVSGPLASILSYHLVPGLVMTADMSDGLEVTTGTGGTAVITIEDGVPHFNGVEIVQADIACSNGVIHAIALMTRPPEDETSIDESAATAVFDYNEGADWETLRNHMGETVVVIGTVGAVQGEAAGQVPALDGSDQIQIYLGSAEMLDEPLNPQNRFVAAIPPIR